MEEEIITIRNTQVALLKDQTSISKPLRVGSTVKILIRQYDNRYISCPAIVIGIANFNNLPSIELMYIDTGSAEVKFLTYNNNTDTIEIAPFSAFETQLTRPQIREILVNRVNKSLEELRTARSRLTIFDELFGKLIGPDNEKEET